MFRKKIPSRRIIPPFFLQKFRIWPFLNYLHDSNSIFRAAGINSEGVFGRTVGPRKPLPGPPPLVEEVPQDEKGDDEAMESGALSPTIAGVGFSEPTKRKLVKRVLGKCTFSRGRRSSLIVKAASLSTHDFVLLQEQVTALSNSRQSEDKKEVQVVAEHESDISATELEPSASLG